MPYDKTTKNFRNIHVKSELYDKLEALAKKTAKSQGLTTISRPTMIELMIKRYEES